MQGFCVLEGVDGSGKTHLCRVLRDHLASTDLQGVLVLTKDDCTKDPPARRAGAEAAWGRERLGALHRLVWSYDDGEPVWTYPRRYWLHALCSWFQLYHHLLVAPAVATGNLVITDGWYFKHLARFQLADDEQIRAAARAAFAELPAPDLIVWVRADSRHLQGRKGAGKPSERGAFEDATAAAGTEKDLVAYQDRVAAGLESVLQPHTVMQIRDSTVHPSILLGEIRARWGEGR